MFGLRVSWLEPSDGNWRRQLTPAKRFPSNLICLGFRCLRPLPPGIVVRVLYEGDWPDLCTSRIPACIYCLPCCMLPTIGNLLHAAPPPMKLSDCCRVIATALLVLMKQMVIHVSRSTRLDPNLHAVTPTCTLRKCVRVCPSHEVRSFGYSECKPKACELG